MNRRWVVASLAVAVLLVGGGAAYSAGRTSDAKSKLSRVEDTLVSRLAKELGVSEARLRTAMKKAGSATIDDALRQGLITKEQAEFLKGRLSSEGLEFELGLGRFKHGFKDHGNKAFKHGRFAGLTQLAANEKARTAVADAIAGKLGMTRAELAKALGEDKELEELAAAKHLTEADLGKAAAAALKPYVDALVKDGKLDRATADSLLGHLSRGEALGKILRFSLFANR
jgi:uncharacterized protein YidB (DUF937 family)